MIQSNGKIVKERISVPEGYERVKTESNSFSEYLQTFPLKPHGKEVYYFDGRKKLGNYHVAVLDIDVGKKDLQQCADAVMRLRAEYLFKYKKFSQIHFNFTNGFNAEYAKWKEGWRVAIKGNQTSWIKNAKPDESYQSFRKYMDLVFSYAGTLSLSKELKPVELGKAQIGDVFIQGGSPGHAVLIVDMAIHSKTGEKICLVVQSYMPAQDIHILRNPNDDELSPWIKIPENQLEAEFITPQWDFVRKDLKRF
ncbi:MAG: DUF4846 domain-containing protein [Flammeovirgaceae bacterium]